uniref:Uncharacterized protein n=1 Tax=Avena sativa TaxID=4498 RepID=A0ACD5WM03_AVESA
MRKLGAAQDLLRAAIDLGVQVETGTNNCESTKTTSMWAKIWNERDVQVMVVISLALQLFLLIAGNIRRRRRVGWLRFFLWLAYLSAYPAISSAIGLFSQYEDKYKLRGPQSSSDSLHTLTMPFLWAPFLILHLGGPDSITAFSIEDNNLWTRQLISLVFQLSLALYVFWKSYDLLDSQLLAVAVPLFLAGIIKYGERIWALKSGSRESLDRGSKKEKPIIRPDNSTSRSGAAAGPATGGAPSGCAQPARSVDTHGGAAQRSEDSLHDQPKTVDPQPGDLVASCALRSMLSGRGLLVGRKLYHLSDKDAKAYLGSFTRTKDKLKFVLMELGMIYDMLYTKAMVLQSWTGGVFRGIALLAIMLAFVLFWVNQHLHTHRTTNSAITYMLFIATILVELYSILVMIASPQTRVRFKFLRCLSGILSSCFRTQGLSNPSMGQFNLVEYSLSTKSRPKFFSKVLVVLGLEKHWRNFWYVKHVEDKVMADYIVGLLNFKHNPCRERSHKLELGTELRHLLLIPFEHALHCLHIFTDVHLRTLGGCRISEMMVLAAECTKLSNYLMYLLAVYPSMLPVNNSVQDLLSSFTEWVRENPEGANSAILHRYSIEVIYMKFHQQFPLKEVSIDSLKDLKELWARLLIYAAGKCSMELHARQLSEGLELLTVVGSLLMHCGIGNAAGFKQLDLLAPRPGNTSQEKLVDVQFAAWITIIKTEEPVFAFEFSEQTQDEQVLQQRTAQSTSQPQPSRLYVEAWAGDKPGEHVFEQPPAQSSSQPGTSAGRKQAAIRRPQFSERWTDFSSSMQVKPRRADVELGPDIEQDDVELGSDIEQDDVELGSEIEQDDVALELDIGQAVAHRKHVRHRAVSGAAVQSPPDNISRALSL